jgi:hypothetical protein
MPTPIRAHAPAAPDAAPGVDAGRAIALGRSGSSEAAEVLAKLPDEHAMRAIDLERERRRARGEDDL